MFCFFNDLQSCKAQQQSFPSSASPTTHQNSPLVYRYKKDGGTIDEQSHIQSNADARDAAIATHGRSNDLTNSGLYAFVALLFAVAAIIVWRRTRL